MATLLMQTADHVVATSSELLGGSHGDRGQGGRIRPRKAARNGPKKQPQRGLGVAQLEKLRLQEQMMQQSGSFPPFHAQGSPFSAMSALRELQTALCVPNFLGYGKGLTQNAVTLPTLKFAQPGNEKSLSVFNSVAEISPGMVSSQSSTVFDRPTSDNGSVSSVIRPLRSQLDTGEYEVSGVHDLQDRSLDLAGVNEMPKVVNESNKVEILTQQSGFVGSPQGPKGIFDHSSIESLLDQAGCMKMWKPADIYSRNALKPGLGCSKPPSISCLDGSDHNYEIERAKDGESYTQNINHKEEIEKSKDDDSCTLNRNHEHEIKRVEVDGGGGDRCPLSSSVTDLGNARPGPPGILQPQPFHTDISSVLISSFGEKPKELSSFQNYLDLYVWPSIEKVSVQKRKWPVMLDPGSTLKSSEVGHNCKAFEPSLKSQRCTDFETSSIPNHKVGLLCGLGSERKSLTKTASNWMVSDSVPSKPVVPINQNLLTLAKQWTGCTQFGHVPSLESYVAHPIVYSALKSNSFDHKKACTSGEILPVQMVPMTEGCEMEVQGQQLSPTVDYWMVVSTDQCGLTEGLTNQKSEFNADAKGTPLDLSLKLAL